MQVTFRDLKKQTVQVDVEPSDLVLSAKEKVATAKDVDPSQLKFVYSGKVLQDDKPLSDFKIKEGDSIIFMVGKKKTPTPQPVGDKPKESKSEDKPATASGASGASATSGASASSGASGANTSSAAPAEGETTGAADFSSGSEREAAIQNMLEMGYERPQIEQALRAAVVGSSIATSGTRCCPNTETSTDAVAPTEQDTSREEAQPHENMFEAAEAAAAGERGEDAHAEPNLDDHSSQLATLRAALQSNPELIQPMLDQLAASNPQIAEMIEQDPEGFMRTFLGTGGDDDDLGFEIEGEGGEGEQEEGTVRITLTEQDESAINRLCELGFERNLVIQVYMACDKNEEVAADILFRDT
ncbi:UV excision repair protein Rad23 [Candidozyma auris]|nr:UV excision repair protein Rad23 [[Candida] auris]